MYRKIIVIILAVLAFAYLTAVNIDVGIRGKQIKGYSAGAVDIKATANITDVHLRFYIPKWQEIIMMAKTGWGEARGSSTTEVAGVYWNILNRVDSPLWPDTIAEVITQRNPIQYCGWDADYPVDAELLELAKDVVTRWLAEKFSEPDAGRVLPKEYVYFSGDGKHNYFRTAGGKVWNWTLPSPYEN